MIKLYKTAEKNEKIKAVIADLRKTSRPFSFKYYCMDERISWVMSHYDLESWGMARKITWILTGDCARQMQICETIGTDYAMYVPSSYSASNAEKGEDYE